MKKLLGYFENNRQNNGCTIICVKLLTKIYYTIVYTGNTKLVKQAYIKFL